MQHVQGSNEELMCILLLIACKMAGVSPHQVQEFKGNVWRARARVELNNMNDELHMDQAHQASLDLQKKCITFHKPVGINFPFHRPHTDLVQPLSSICVHQRESSLSGQECGQELGLCSS